MVAAGGNRVNDATLRLGTRRSPMAMAQSAHVAGLVTARTGHQVELVGLTTFGDVSQADLAQIGGTGVFVSELRKRLLGGDIDFAVHSLKDLPTGQDSALTLAAVPPREDPRDALAARNGAKLADLPTAARIGTGSPRRAAQLLMIRPDLRPVPIRGNAGTRLGKVDSGEVDAVVLAYAGLARIGRLDAVTQVFEPDEMMPAPGQGALAVECLASRPDLARLLRQVDDRPSRAAAEAERTEQDQAGWPGILRRERPDRGPASSHRARIPESPRRACRSSPGRRRRAPRRRPRPSRPFRGAFLRYLGSAPAAGPA